MTVPIKVVTNAKCHAKGSVTRGAKICMYIYDVQQITRLYINPLGRRNNSSPLFCPFPPPPLQPQPPPFPNPPPPVITSRDPLKVTPRTKEKFVESCGLDGSGVKLGCHSQPLGLTCLDMSARLPPPWLSWLPVSTLLPHSRLLLSRTF